MKISNKINGIVLCKRLSAIDNKTPIVIIATGLTKKTSNSKTGNMIQTWIIADNGFHPSEAIKNGTDYSICGNCPHRYNPETKKRSCYVNQMAVGSVYRSYKKGNYIDYDPSLHDFLFFDRAIRFGSYGDPVNIPLILLEHLKNLSSNHTGYTHQWKLPQFSEYKKYFQASVDSIDEYFEAIDNKWATFRVRALSDDGNKSTGEVECQGGKKTTCQLCSLCNGNSTKPANVVITAHGPGAKHV